MRRILIVGAATLLGLGVGGTALAATNHEQHPAVDDRGVHPSPTAIVSLTPAPTWSHDAGDDKGGLRAGGGHGADDPAPHDAGDDKGGNRHGGSGR